MSAATSEHVNDEVDRPKRQVPAVARTRGARRRTASRVVQADHLAQAAAAIDATVAQDRRRPSGAIVEDILALAALKTGRPVKFELTREEQFIATSI